MTKCTLLAALVLCVVAPWPGHAGDDPLEPIIEQQLELAGQLDSGELDLAPGDAEAFRKNQARVFELVSPGTRLEDLRIEQRVQLDNALQRINAIVVGTRLADDDQRQCRSEKATGSQLRKLVCRTKGEWRQIAEDAQDYKGRGFICVPPGCGEHASDSAMRPGGR